MKDEQNDVINNDEEAAYKELLANSKKDLKDQYALSDHKQKNIIKTGKNTARITNIMISLAILLLIIPVMTLFTYGYYAFGGRGDRLIDVAAKTIYVTEPNMSLEEMELEHEIGFFSMDIFFDVYKRIGKEDFKAADYNIHFALNQPSFPEKNNYLDRPLPELPNAETESLLHPEVAIIPFDREREWNILKKLPDGTVGEVHLSLSKLVDPDELEDMIPDDIEIRWLAVDTGLEAKGVDHEGVPVGPIGYPALIDTTTWSPFNGRDQTNAEVFVDILSLLEKNEVVAEKVARAKTLEIGKRLDYIEKNGIKVYGAVVTGPTEELRKLEQIKDIRTMKVGEVKLWNWE
nr:anti-sigma factor [Neobacillus sp. Marseille-Q6967]